jgi:hypothetical protein
MPGQAKLLDDVRADEPTATSDQREHSWNTSTGNKEQYVRLEFAMV